MALENTLQPHRDLAYGGVLGEGGMGIVYQAEEHALGRTLAVKRLRQDRLESTHVRALLREARITSAVSHPNVVPVHDVRMDEHGKPVILLKRIEGQPWSRLLRDPDLSAQILGDRDPLAGHVGVLIRVCAAVHAAHAHHIVHRDLKPGNVMVGPNGEVYVVDWGLAATLDEGADPRLPRLSDTQPGAGTPQYMAPEMVSNRYGEVGPWTDVYLLGGLLFQLLHGRPPHGGTSAMNMVIEACRNGVEVPDDGPDELVDLTRRCLAREPAARIQDAETVRRALITWLDHRASVALAEDGRIEEARLKTCMEESGSGPTAPSVHDRFGAAVFAYHRAIEAWADNPAAHEGLLRTVRALVDHALPRAELSVARAAVAYLPVVPADLQQQLDAAQAEADDRAAARARWTQLGLGDLNVAAHVGANRLWLMGGGFALVASSSLVALASLPLGGPSTSSLFIGAVTGALAVALVLARVGLHAPIGVDRRIGGHLLFFALARVLVLGGCSLAGIAPHAAIALDLGTVTLQLLFQSLAFNPRLRPGALVPATCGVLAVVVPAAAPGLLALGLTSLAVLNTLSDVSTRRELHG